MIEVSSAEEHADEKAVCIAELLGYIGLHKAYALFVAAHSHTEGEAGHSARSPVPLYRLRPILEPLN